MRLLSGASSNRKLEKSSDRAGAEGYRIWDLSLRPANLSGFNVCHYSTPSCRAACVLEKAGHGNRGSVKDARDRRTVKLFTQRRQFLADLHADLHNADELAQRDNLRALVRLNVGSDVPWETLAPSLFECRIVAYDYTKVRPRFDRKLPSNYHLTYSHNERTPDGFSQELLRRGINVAVVFDTLYQPRWGRVNALPTHWKRFKVIDGDTHDLRLPETDGRGVVVGLRGKGGYGNVLAGVAGGFIQRVPGGVADLKGVRR